MARATVACRGLILDDADRVVARPFPKFFGPSEPDAPAVPTHREWRRSSRRRHVASSAPGRHPCCVRRTRRPSRAATKLRTQAGSERATGDCRWESAARGGHRTLGSGRGLPCVRKSSTTSATTDRIPASAACRSGSSQLTRGNPSHRPTHSRSSSDHSVQYRYSCSTIVVLHHVQSPQNLADLIGLRPALARLQDQHGMIHPRRVVDQVATPTSSRHAEA